MLSDGRRRQQLPRSTACARGLESTCTSLILKIAICFNGYYSRHETRTHHHSQTRRLMNKAGENTISLVRLFVRRGECSDVFNLYLLAVRTGIGWTVKVDRWGKFVGPKFHQKAGVQ